MESFTKTCVKCKIDKPIFEFSKDKHRKTGLKDRCICCDKLYWKKWRSNNKERCRQYEKTKALLHPVKYKEKQKRRMIRARPQVAAFNRIYRVKCKDLIKERSKNRRINAINSGTCFKHKGVKSLKPGACKICVIKLSVYRFAYRAMKAIRTQRKIPVNKLGCSIEEFKKHIESFFLPNMNWLNYGDWVFDHIKPIATLSASSSMDEIEKINHYSNLQPLWNKANYTKGSWFKGNRYENGVIVSSNNESEPDWKLINLEEDLRKGINHGIP